MNLDSINCVITGISGETAAELSKHLLEDGLTIIGTSRADLDDQQLRTIASREFTIGMDPLHQESIQNALNTLIGELGQIHVWINMVGGFEMGDPIEASSPESWKQMYDVNFQTALNATRVILPHFKAFKAGRIINFGSSAVLSGMALAAPYLASKSAVHALTKACATELTDDVTCNAILPGTIDTVRNRTAMPRADFSSWVSTRSIAESVLHLIKSSDNGELITL